MLRLTGGTVQSDTLVTYTIPWSPPEPTNITDWFTCTVALTQGTLLPSPEKAENLNRLVWIPVQKK